MIAIATTNRTQRQRFCDGFEPFHSEEIAAAKELCTAAVLLYGRRSLQRLLRKDAGKAFERLRYGRRLMPLLDRQENRSVCLLIDRAPYFSHKAGSDHIMFPGHKGWATFAEQVKVLALSPRWAGGFTAAAKVLDDLGYAIAESLAAMMAFGIEGDDDVWAPR
jgi:hypothetical protein